VTATIEQLHDQISREVREANLATDSPTEVDILRRRFQIAFIGIVVVFGLLVTTFANDLWANVKDSSWIDPEAARIALLVFTGWIAFYLWEKERHLKRVTKLSGELQRLDSDLAGNLLHSALVLDSVEVAHSSLELDVVTRRVVEQARGLLGASSGALYFVDEDRTLLPAEAQTENGAARAAPDGLLQFLGDGRAAVQLVSSVGAMLCAPLRTQAGTVAVLTVVTEDTERWNDESRALLERFARSAAVAVENARRYEAAVFLLDVQAGSTVDLV
jgi:GAF domain